MNRRRFLHTSGLATASLGSLALELTPSVAGAPSFAAISLDMTVFSAVETAFSILIANILKGRSLASDWDLIGSNLTAIERFWVTHNVDAVLAGSLLKLSVENLTPPLINLQTLLQRVQIFAPNTTLAQLQDGFKFVEEIPTAIKQATLEDLHRDGLLYALGQAICSAARVSAEIQGFTVTTKHAPHNPEIPHLRQTPMLSNVAQSLSIAGIVFATLAVMSPPNGWDAITGLGVYATAAAGITARVFSSKPSSRTPSRS